VSAGRFQALSHLRRRARFDTQLGELAERLAQPEAEQKEDVGDDRLRLIFTCCHPELPVEAQIALTLREVCGLTTEAIARAFLTTPAALAQRIVRAKARIQQEGIPYAVPDLAQLLPRLDAVLRVVYLVFNEGWSAASGSPADALCLEAIRLCRLLVELLPEPEARGLLALLLLQEARRPARFSATGELVLLEDQDRSLWNAELIAEGAGLVEQALRSRRFGPYTLQAAIAAVHAEARDARTTDWAEVTGLYDLLLRVEPSPVVELNRAVAVAMRDGPEAGLELVDGIVARGQLGDYALLHAARGELCRRLGRVPQARVAFERALALAKLEPERRLLRQRLGALSS
jgi:RNA polymerase sigma-70 factor (ECF subfamily)